MPKKTGTIFPPILMLGASFGECNKIVAVTCFVTAVGLMAFFTSGVNVNCLDLSPNYAGMLMAFTNSISLFGALPAPYMTALFTPNV